jgi:hypothetical protein
VCEADEGPGGIVIFYLVPAGAEVGCQRPQPADLPAVRRRAGVGDDDVDYVEFPFVCSVSCALCSHHDMLPLPYGRRTRLPHVLVGVTRMKCAGTPSIHGSSPAPMSGARSASVSR